MKFLCGDVFLSDSNRFGPKIVKFLMQAPTVWQWLWRAIRRTQEPVRYYHAGMLFSDDTLVEQQWKVQYAPACKILNWRVIVYRMKNLTEIELKVLKMRMQEDISKTYNIPQILGKTLTWLTGIKWFVRWFGAISKEQEICVTRVGDWYWGICNFGVKTKHELTTKIIDEYCAKHPEQWDIAYVGQGKVKW